MRLRSLFLAAAAAALILPLQPRAVDGQILNRVRQARENALDEIANALDERMRNAIRCTLGDVPCAERAQAEGKDAVFVGDDGEVITNDDGEPIFDHDEAAQQVGYVPPAADGDASSALNDDVYRTYDFVPGAKVVFAMDLEAEREGRWPARQLDFVRGAGQIVRRGEGRTIEFTDATTFNVHLSEPLPDDFTIELTFQASMSNSGMSLAPGEMPGNMRVYDYNYLSLWRGAGINLGATAVSSTDTLRSIAEQPVSFKMQVDGDPEASGEGSDYTILYAGTDRIAMVPNATWERSDMLQLHIPARGDRPAYLSELVVAIHGDPLYESLTTGDGTFTTRGILFDVDSDALRGESFPQLDELRRTLDLNTDLSVAIEGHTDAQGADDHNLDLSQRRAQAVVDWLVAEGIDAERLDAVGKGEAEPTADNATAAGRQQNRRVVVRNVALAGAPDR